MMQDRTSRWISRAMLWIIPGSMILGTSCVGDIRKSIVAAGLGFVEDSAGAFLESTFPVSDLLTTGS